MPQDFWLYLSASALVTAGYADYPLIADHFQKDSITAANTLPLLYALVMGVDAIAALVFRQRIDCDVIILL